MLNKTALAREVSAKYPDTKEGRYLAASELITLLEITRNYARRLVHAAKSSPIRGGKRPGAGRLPKITQKENTK